MVAQPVVKEIPLPANTMNSSQIPFPLFDCGFHPWRDGKRKYRVKMIWHEQHEATMPAKTKVVIGSRRKDSVPNAGPTKLIVPGRLAVNRDKERTASLNPLGNLMG